MISGGETRYLDGTCASPSYSSIPGFRDLDGAVSAEIEENHRVAVLDRSDRSAFFGNDERREVLVDRPGLAAKRLDGFLGRSELPALAEDVNMPPFLDHAPVGFIAVHRDAHPSAAGSDPRVESTVAERSEEFLKRTDVFQSGRFSNVSSVQKDMDTDAPDLLFLRLLDHRFQMVDVRMNVAVREQSQEMHGATVFLHEADLLLPSLRLEDLSAFDGV